MTAVLVVDDEPLQREILKTILDSEGYETYTASSGAEALDTVLRLRPEVVLTDLKMEGMDGIELCEAIKSHASAIESGIGPAVIIMTAHGTISSAVEAVKKGAFDYLTKPLEKDALLLTVSRAVERADLVRENAELRRELYGKFRIEGIVGSSDRMRKVVETLKKVSPTPATVLIKGESGTGKELVARAIHYNSPRRSKPFTALNCSAIPEGLFESELFGSEQGAFTGATSRREGLIEATNGGTLFLDEIADMPPAAQAKLLRVLQDREVRRLGGKSAIKVDIRIIAATNKDIEKELSKGGFREDLYYRLNVVAIELPPLRERKEDIPELVEFFLRKYNKEFGRKVRGIEPPALKALSEYGWPGNIRQLEYSIERAALMNDTGVINMGDIKGELIWAGKPAALDIEIPEGGLDFEAFEKELLTKAMARSGGVASKAAKLLRMSYKTFLYRLEKFNLAPKKGHGE